MKDKWIWIVIAVVVVLVVLFVILQDHKNSTTGQYGSTSSSQTQNNTNNGTTPTGSDNGSSSTSPSALTEDINSYQYRVQFSSCHGAVNLTSAGTLSIKKGVKFLLDNRDPVAHTIAFTGHSYRIPAYGFAVGVPTVSGEYPITCDGGGAATLDVSP